MDTGLRPEQQQAGDLTDDRHEVAQDAEAHHPREADPEVLAADPSLRRQQQIVPIHGGALPRGAIPSQNAGRGNAGGPPYGAMCAAVSSARAASSSAWNAGLVISRATRTFPSTCPASMSAR